MAFRKVSAGNGINWLLEAVRLILKNPVPFLLMGLVVAAVSLVPVLGGLALMIAGPALYGGVAYAGREQGLGGEARFEHIGAAFQQQGKLGPMLALCLPGVVVGIIAVVVLVIFVTIAAVGAGVTVATESTGAMLAGLGMGFLISFVILLPLMLAAFAATFFAVPEIMFARNDAFAAMRESLRASMQNIGALLLYVVVVFGVSFVVSVVLGVISAILAQLLLSAALFPVIGVSMYLAWRDVYQSLAPEELPAEQGSEPAPPAPGNGPEDDGGMVA